MKYNRIIFTFLIFSSIMSSPVMCNFGKAWAQTVIDTVNVGPDIFDLEYNPSNEDIYAANRGSSDVSVIRDTLPPTADAGPNQTVESSVTVQLDGSGSSDPSGGTLTYQWTQTSGPEVTLIGADSVNPTFTAPETGVEETIVFELVVTNEDGVESQPDSVTITVNPVIPPPTPPEPPLEGIIGSGNNINIQVQQNTGNNVGGQSGDGKGDMYSDSPIHQDQSTNQDSRVIS